MVHIEVWEYPSVLKDEALFKLIDWSPEERGRIAEFRVASAKTSWCLARLFMENALRKFSGIPDAHRRIALGGFGKPFIPGCDIHFNWSHAEGCAALAVAHGQEVGVDIEGVGRIGMDHIGIGDDQFRKEERAWISSAPDCESWERFLSLFVQKEAWLKAAGRGLSLPLADVPSSLALPPCRSPGRILIEGGSKGRYFLAVDASTGTESNEVQFSIENREWPE